MTDGNRNKDQYVISSYSFVDEGSYLEAVKEYETIQYIGVNVDFNDENKLIKLYISLIEKNSFKTVIGYDFLKELRDKIVSRNMDMDKALPYINIHTSSLPNSLKEFSAIQSENQKVKLMEQVGKYKVKTRNTFIVNAFLVIIIGIMLIISLYSDRTVFSKFENDIIDKYASWQEDLEAREKALIEKENAFNMQED